MVTGTPATEKGNNKEKALHETGKKMRVFRNLLFAFLAGALLSGFFFNRRGSESIGELNSRYAYENGRAAQIIGNLADELERERELNKLLREHNNTARDIANRITDTTERNVRNLQDAIGIISEIRAKLKVLEDFFADSSTGGSFD